jgi:hypothetical protein
MTMRSWNGSEPENAMTRRKGERSLSIVELRVPENGFGHVRDAIELFHVSQNIEVRGDIGRQQAGADYARFCFADPQYARDFAELFGGRMIEVAS